MRLGEELRSRGFEDAARQLYVTTDQDYERLLGQVLRVELLRDGRVPAAEALLGRWIEQSPTSPVARRWRVVIHLATGETELAERELADLLEGGDLFLAKAKLLLASRQGPEAFDQLSKVESAARDPFIGLVARIVAMQASGIVPSLETNPWGMRFVGPAGVYAPGKIDPAQAARIPSGTLAAMIRLVEILPNRGNLWALLGELFNAAGETAAALECVKRAQVLGYTPRLLLEHRVALEVHEQRLAGQALGAVPPAPPARGADPGSLPGESGPGPAAAPVRSPRTIIILAVGGLVVLILAVLQARQWLRPGRPTETRVV